MTHLVRPQANTGRKKFLKIKIAQVVCRLKLPSGAKLFSASYKELHFCRLLNYKLNQCYQLSDLLCPLNTLNFPNANG